MWMFCRNTLTSIHIYLRSSQLPLHCLRALWSLTLNQKSGWRDHWWSGLKLVKWNINLFIYLWLWIRYQPQKVTFKWSQVRGFERLVLPSWVWIIHIHESPSFLFGVNFLKFYLISYVDHDFESRKLEFHKGFLCSYFVTFIRSDKTFTLYSYNELSLQWSFNIIHPILLPWIILISCLTTWIIK